MTVNKRQTLTGLSAALAACALGAVVAGWMPVRGNAQSAEQASEQEFPLVGDEGQQLPNHTVKLLGPIDRLPGVVAVGNPAGSETLAEFYDLNCPYCRRAASDIGALLERDPQLRLVLVPFPVLGIPSITAGRVELAVAKLGTPAQFYAFHRTVFTLRGPVDGNRALEVARGLGLDRKKLLALANNDEITRTMTNLVSLGNALGLEATPSFVAGKLAILGYPGPQALASIVSALGECGKAVC
jgi:protein-disulfide isomerase